MPKRNLSHSYSHSHLHFIIVVLSVLVVVLGFTFLNSTINATNQKLDYQNQISKKQCDTVSGSPVIDVTQRILNDADSGQAGNYWAFDTLNRQIKVYKQQNGAYCALVDYDGQFVGQAGQTSPGATGTLTGSERGTVHGGYRALITGNLLNNPVLPLHGSIGTTDYQCDLSGNCPGGFNWMDKYFNTSAPSFTSSLVWWGWTYKNESHVWINASTGNSGDVL